MSEYIGCKYAVGLSCGTAALHLAAKLAGERLYGQAKPNQGTLAGHKVFCSDVTFDASVNPVAYEDPDIPSQESPRQIFEEEDKPVEKMNYIEISRCYFKALTITQKRPSTNRRIYFLIRQDHSAMRIYINQKKAIYGGA